MTISSVRSVDIWAPVCAQQWCRGGAGDGGVDGAALVSGRRRGRRGDGGVGAALATMVWTGRRWYRGGVEGGGAAALGEERGRGSRARAREREGIDTK